MFKKISLMLVLVLVIGALSACASAGLGTSQLSEEKKAEIEEAWYARVSTTWRWAADGDTEGCRYYGNFGGYDILFYQGGVSTAALKTIRVGESCFSYTGGFNMFAYKDETLYVLKELYEDGKIGADAVAQAAQYHKNDGKHLSLSDEVKAKIERAEARMSDPINWSAKDRQPGAIRYYGNFEGYDVFFLYDAKPGASHGNYYQIGSERLAVPYYNCMFFAYKDHNIGFLQSMYKEGKLSDESVTAIAKVHNKYDNKSYYESPRASETT